MLGGATLAHYVNTGRVVQLDATLVVWDDYAVDVIRYADGAVEVVDEEEIVTTDAATRAWISEATAAVVADVVVIVATVEHETQALLGVEGRLPEMPFAGEAWPGLARER
jgi:hypothetical protein